MKIITADEQLRNPALEQRAVSLGQQIKCPVCEGQSINGSNAELAVALRIFVREQITAGHSDQEIIDNLIARYGNRISFKPTTNNIIWFIPLIILAVGLMIYWYFNKKQHCY